MIYRITLSSLVLISSISLVSAAADPFQSAIDDILRMPTVSKSTLPDGSLVTTVSIPGNYPTKAGTIVSPAGSVLQFTTQLGDSHSSATTLSNYTTNPASSTLDFLSSPTRSLLQSTTSNPVDILSSAYTRSQSYRTVFTDTSRQSVVISFSPTHPCSSVASLYSATNGTPFDLSSTSLTAITSVLTSGPASPVQSDSIREASIAPVSVDTTPAGFTRIFTSEKVP